MCVLTSLLTFEAAWELNIKWVTRLIQERCCPSVFLYHRRNFYFMRLWLFLVPCVLGYTEIYWDTDRRIILVILMAVIIVCFMPDRKGASIKCWQYGRHKSLFSFWSLDMQGLLARCVTLSSITGINNLLLHVDDGQENTFLYIVFGHLPSWTCHRNVWGCQCTCCGT